MYRRGTGFNPQFFQNESTALSSRARRSWPPVHAVVESLSGDSSGFVADTGKGETFNLRACPKVASGTVDMPTASAPRIPKARISAGVSNAGRRRQRTRLREFSYRSLLLIDEQAAER